jgi:hypothetical protein
MWRDLGMPDVIPLGLGWVEHLTGLFCVIWCRADCALVRRDGAAGYRQMNWLILLNDQGTAGGIVNNPQDESTKKQTNKQ